MRASTRLAAVPGVDLGVVVFAVAGVVDVALGGLLVAADQLPLGATEAVAVRVVVHQGAVHHVVIVLVVDPVAGLDLRLVEGAALIRETGVTANRVRLPLVQGDVTGGEDDEQSEGQCLLHHDSLSHVP